MANKHIKKPDIPTVFNIDNYKKCKPWGLKEWADALSFRHAMRSAWNGIINPSHSVLSIFEENSRSSLINRVKVHLHNDSIYLFRDPSYSSAEQLHEYSIFFVRDNDKSTHIRNQAAADLFQFEMDFFFDNPRYAEWVKRSAYLRKTGMSDNDSEALILEWGKFLGTPAWKMHAECSKSGSSIPIQQIFIGVDLRAPDDILVKDFKQWLKRIRKDTELPNLTDAFNSDDFTDWHTKRLLPFLDLTFWKIIHNEEIDYDEIGDALFPGAASHNGKAINKEAVDFLDKKRDGERIEGNTEPNALRLVSDRYVSALNNQLNLPDTETQIRNNKRNT